jgi:multisubunit Na+/H+ antiporter MnhB subunit
MELLFTVLFIALFFVVSYKMAESRGRNAWGWAVGGLIVSPLLVWIMLLLIGKTDDQKAKELIQSNLMKELIK